ncbi:MAG: transcription termination factor NusA [Lentimicrobiaceae bacterium]|nr:transcription termination factor NusA [Lentimicrobiaceae bacterium]
MAENEHINLVDTFAEFKEFKNIDREALMRILEDVFRSVLIKKYGTDENIDIIVNVDKGDLEIWRKRSIVDDADLEDETLEIKLSEAIKIEPDFEIGEEVIEPIYLSEIGRREILTVRQILVSKLQEYEKDIIYRKYKDKVGEVITGEVYQAWKNEVLILDDEDIELTLPRSQQIPGDFFRKNDTIRAVVYDVEMRKNVPTIVLSRTAPIFLERLLELEVPEIYDGLISIKKIVRHPGERAKVAVESYDDRIDPVGACVGVKGSRIHGIVKELRSENIDIINFTTNTILYIQRALSPAKTTKVVIDEENKRANVFMKPDQVSLAIGKGGHNIKLAGELTGYEIDVYRDSDNDTDFEDVELQEFSDEIEQWIIDDLKSIGCDTAKSVLELSVEELVRRTTLEEETIIEVRKILKSEFE